MSRRRRSVLAGAVAALSIGIAGCLGLNQAEVSETFERVKPIPDGAEVSVSTPTGNVAVTSHEGTELQIAGEKSVRGDESDLDRVSVTVDSGPETIITAEIEEPGFFGGGGACDLDIKVPEGITVTSAATENGQVSVQDTMGDLTAVSDNGNVEVENVQGYVSGSVENGTVSIRGTTGLRGAEATNGTVDVDVHDIRDSVSVTTNNGGITVSVGDSLACGVVLSADNGGVNLEDVELEVSEQSDDRVEGQLGDTSSPELRAGTGNGDITLRSATTDPA